MSIVPNLLHRIEDRTLGTSGRRTNQRRRNVVRVLGAHRNVSPLISRTRGRQGRLVSQPDPRMVDAIRQEERARGGPSAPRNSLDLSVETITLDETIDNDNQTSEDNLSADFVTVEDGLDDGRDSRDRSGHRVGDLNQGDVFDDYHGVPPVNPSQSQVPDVHHNENEDEAVEAFDQTTIDLTNSPPRIALPRLLSPSNAPHSFDQMPPRTRILSPQLTNNDSPSPAQPVPSSASLKCPVCLEPFLSIRRRGSNLVSTVCGHVFCGKCLPACVRISGHCPTCRMKVGYDDFHPLYLL